METNKKYWKGFEELSETPQFVESRDNEFAPDVPVDEFMGSEEAKGFKTDRRDFLKFLGFSVAAATLAACEKPITKSVPYVNKPEDVTPGVANWYASAYYDGNDYGSILVKTREGRPIMVKGNKDHGINGAVTTPRMVASVLSLYNEARLHGPIKHVATGKANLSWADVDSEVGAKLTSIVNKGGKVRLVTRSIISPSTRLAINAFTTKYGGSEAFPMESREVDSGDQKDGQVQPVLAATVGAAISSPFVENSRVAADVQHIVMDEISYYGIRKANKDSFGEAMIPSYDFAKAKVIVGIGCDFLNGWLMSSVNMRQYGLTRKPEKGWMSRHYQFEANMSQTGSNADVRARIKPSKEGTVAAAILNGIDGGQGAPYEGATLETNIAIAKAVHDLKENKGAGLVVSGSNDSNVQMIVNAINVALGNYGTTIDVSAPIEMGRNDDEKLSQFNDDLTGGKVDAVIFYDVNPVYCAPNGEALSEAIGNCELSVSFAMYDDETASACEYICPDSHYLESWNDYNPKKGHYSLAQPVIRPLYDTRQAQETLLVWAGEEERSVSKDSTVFYQFIQDVWEKYGYNIMPIEAQKDGFSSYWNRAVHNGSIDEEVSESELMPFSGDLTSAVAAATGIPEQEWELSIYQKAGIGTGKDAANPWLQEMPDPLSKVSWDNYVTMAPTDVLSVFPGSIAEDENGKKQDEITDFDPWNSLYIGESTPARMVEVSFGGKTLKLPVFPMPGQAAGTIGIAMGYGRGAHATAEPLIGKAAYCTKEYGGFETGADGNIVPIGKNAFLLRGEQNGTAAYGGMGVTVSPIDETFPLACAQTHHTVMGRTSVVRETTMNTYLTEDSSVYNPPHELSMIKDGRHQKVPVAEADLWDEHPVEDIGHRWGMAIDLTSCFGCGACLISCTAENNVPVVGKDEVRRSRDMHWLRLDRYFSSVEDENRAGWVDNPTTGDFDYLKMEIPQSNPQVVYMPMMCQHCNHAPCETVCPVAATTHSNEGLNQMTYNRCIGTRYCANNCPYKVRRFNWFNYQGYKKFDSINPAQQELGRMVLNPDVVVRSRGVMEKCSFCVQEIQAAKLKAKKAGRPLNDSDVSCACSDACPADAISFGDWNDKESAVRKDADSDRAYQSLEEVGVKPNVWYKVKVRNVEETVAVDVADHEDDHAENHNGH
jgi:molybdopterin-containing oxidoreductase family iron-sulfur binding subunit